MFKRLWKNEKGFTLMELIIVIVILGILALIAVPRLIGFTDEAEKAADKEYAAVVAKAAELYWAANKNTDAAITFSDITETNVDNIGGSVKYLVEDPAFGSTLQFYEYVGFAFDDANGVCSFVLSEDGTVDTGDIFYTVSDGYTTGALPTGFLVADFDVIDL